MKHINKLNWFLAFALFLSFAFGPTSTVASAKVEDLIKATVVAPKAPATPTQSTNTIKTCQWGPLNAIGTAPYTETFVGNEPDATAGYSWMTSDTSDVSSVGSGSTFTHTFNNPGTYMVRGTCYKHDGSFAFATTYVTVTDAANKPVIQTPAAPPVGGNTTPSDGNGCPSNITGNGNTVICGNTDMNNTNVTNGEKSTQPVANLSFWQIIGQAFADLIRSWIN